MVAMALCMGLEMTGLVIVLPLFARRFDSFGAGTQALAISSMAYALSGTFVAPIIGMLADRFGRRPMILLSLASCCAALCGFLLAASAWQLIVFRGLAGVSTAVLPLAASVVGDLAPGNQRARWIGIVNSGASAGWIAGPLLGGLLYDRFGYAVACVASIVLAIGALLVAALRVHETHTPEVHPGRPPLAWTGGLRTLRAGPAFLFLLFINLSTMFAWAFCEPQFMFHAYDDLGWSSSQVGLVISAYGVACTSGLFALGHLSDRLGRKPVLLLGLALFSVQFIGLVVLRTVPWLVASFTLSGLGQGLFDPALRALILDMSPAEQTAGMMGLNSMAGSLGTLLGPALAVLFTLSAQVVFLIAAGMVAMLVLASGLVLRTPAKAAQHSSGDGLAQ